MSLSKIKTTTSHFSDYSIYADIDSKGQLVLLTGSSAVENALKLWLLSFPGESIRNPSKGGYVTRWLFKPMTDDTQMMIREAIIEGIQEDFSPALVLKKVVVEPEYEYQRWKIEINAYVPDLKIDLNVYETVRTLQ